MMLKRLRFQLTILYLLASMSLVGLTGAGTYFLLQRYLQSASDQALQYKMALQFDQYGLSLPPELAAAEQSWLKENSQRQGLSTLPASLPAATPLQPTPTLTSSPVQTASPALDSVPVSPPLPDTAVRLQPADRSQALAPILVSFLYDEGGGDDDSGEDGSGSPSKNKHPKAEPSQDSAAAGELTRTTTPEAPAGGPVSAPHPSHGEVNDDAFDARLAPIFITPLNEKGAVEPAAPAAVIPAQAAAPVLFDSQAAAAAMLTGVDWRTVQLSSGSRLRLLTYRTANPAGPALLQAGRLLDDQDNLLKNFLAWIITLSGSSILLLGVASWWLSGRSLGPAEKAWDQQQAFISNASHELRTPLTFIQATAEVALRDHPAPKQKEYLDNILEEIHYLNGMVDDLLLLARRDARRLNLKREAVELPGLFTEIQRQVANRAAEQDITVALGECKQSVWADAARLRQVLLILIDNAIRYTPSGGAVCLEASRHGRLDTIAVSDNGAGIPAEFVPHLFERFYQAPQPETDQSRSNGLGLSIAKALVDAMGGGIAIESQLGKGTRVTVELPAAG